MPPSGSLCSDDLEHVIAVGREVVHDRDAAACAHRRAFDVPHLRHVATELVGDRGGRRVAVAHREAADLAGRAQVPFHERRRHRLNVGHVVEAVTDRVGRQERVHVGIDGEQVVHRARVLRAIQSLERSAAGIRMKRRCLIDFCLERRGKRRQRRDRRTILHRRRRHHAGAQLPDHLLGDVGRLRDFRRIEVLERQPAGLRLVVVTRGAVACDERVLRIDRQPCGGV